MNAATDAINAVKLLDKIEKEPLNPYEHRRFYEEVQEFLKSYWGSKYKGEAMQTTMRETIRSIEVGNFDGMCVETFIAEFTLSEKLKETYTDIAIDYNYNGVIEIVGTRSLTVEETAAQRISQAESIEKLEYARYLELKEKYEGRKR